jgi:hypothetical protein
MTALRRRARVALLALLIVVAGPVAAQTPARTSDPARADDTSDDARGDEAGLSAGFGLAALPAPQGGPLGGYGGLCDRTGESRLDPPEARAVVLEAGAQRIGVVVLDIVIVRTELRARVLEAAAPLGLTGLLVAATHTHSGPGGYIDGWLAERLTAGTHQPGALEAFAAAAAAALTEAASDVRPVTTAVVETDAALAAHRRVEGGPAETALPVLVLAPRDGTAAMVVLAYGAHPTVLTPASEAYSADYVGALRAELAAVGLRPLFLAGPMGDQRPALPADVPPGATEPAQAAAMGAALAARARDAIRGARPARTDVLALSELTLGLPVPHLRRLCPLWWLSWAVRDSVVRLMPRAVTYQALRVGDAAFAAVPAEPGAALGEAIRAAVRGAVPGAVPFVIAHANEWAGYAVTPETYDAGGYEACMSLYGRTFGEQLVDAAELAVLGLDDASAPRAGEPYERCGGAKCPHGD